jgi:hypothetical protein
LADNEGPTETIALNPTGPAVEAGADALAVDTDGDLLAFDQRGSGFSRAVDLPGLGSAKVGLGAFEVQSLPAPPTNFVVTTRIDEDDVGATVTDPGGTGLSLREALRLTDATPGPDTITLLP